MPLKRVLVANRGEIALRVVRACRLLGIETVAAHSRVDAGLRHLVLADDTVCVSESSYLDAQSLIAAAVSRGCDGVHPGYGMLSEDADFARAVRDAGLCFIGPSPDVIDDMGNKITARARAESLGLAVIPGAAIDETVDLEDAGVAIGFPLIVKAAFGGGGRGMRIVRNESELTRAIESAREEARAAFGRAEVYLEKLLENARHVEVQVLGDGAGQAIHLGSRDCSTQRSYQKIIEEAPAPFIDAGKLDAICSASANAAAQMNYAGAGTFEFLYEAGEFYFIEMNTRLQVEHPVTEMITGVDLVAAQLSIAGSGELPFSQGDVKFNGHAVECRVNAETLSPDGSVRPSPGRVSELIVPGGPSVRIDSHLYAGYTVPHQYDSLVMKLIASGEDRDEALRRATLALDELEIRGIETNADLLGAVLVSASFRQGDLGPKLLRDIIAKGSKG